MFTLDNTDGYTPAELEILNAVHAELVAAGIDEKNASDMVHNAYAEGMTVEELRQAVRH